jgi:hypothetical protein
MARHISQQQLQDLLTDCPAKTETYEIDVFVVEQVQHDYAAGQRRLMTDAETSEFATFLNVSPNALVGPLEVDPAACERCGRDVTFLDFAKSGVDQGVHSIPALASILTSRDKAWVTVVGRDGGRDIRCGKCGARINPRQEIDVGYHSGAYDYELPIR